MTTARELARRSQAAAGAGDRAGWLALFADDAVVEDPVGPSPLCPDGQGHRGAAAIAAFYDSVIGQVETMRFEIERSYLCGDEVADVGAIHLKFPTGDTMRVNGVFTYRTDGTGRITALRAFWEFGA
ncbi:nuclear transport factor 2 family protein [Actinoplanes couchii]|uniref:nuclear transport factor 2 family protein n=1 Tax=Actinoplanes couchii TaxID=403638 RepID=UPI0019409860|nr:nuclear transport factor 2 family protein [Actinoplanes couchii]MDR6318305.1 ketosteroid isomerase-like protein [Actinoplanes couchii]